MDSLFHTFFYLVLTFALAKPLGGYMARVYTGKRVWTQPVLGWAERLVYKVCGVDPKQEMGWFTYLISLTTLGFLGFFLLFVILVFQGVLPMNPQGYAGLSADLAFNAAMSFVTNTNWQSYSGEAQLSYFSQAVGLTVQNFLSAATGMAVAVALFRGLKRKQATTIGNAWADVVRGVIYILLPLAFIFSLVLVSQGVIQNFNSYTEYTALESAKETTQLMAQGPAASQVAIKMLGSNGGGFFNVNSAHPFENPTPLTNFMNMISILLIPVALVFCFGVMISDRRQSWVLLSAMTAIFLPLILIAGNLEASGNPLLDKKLVNQEAGNMEGKEVRVGAADSALWAVATTATSNGSVNSMHDSFMPLAGMIPLLLIQFGEVIFGGVGSGAFGMIIYVIITVFIGGLMVGRTPEYLGKKLGPFEIKMASLVIIIPACFVLTGTALAVSLQAGVMATTNEGAQAFSEILYAFSSASNNNGSAFAGLNANSPFYNTILGICMFIGRYWLFVPVLAVAGSLATKNIVPQSPGTLPTHTPLFVVMLVGVIILLDVLTYVPALALGPIAEHMALVEQIQASP
ncbi:MAG: potassium-transporting ATPase subunit KdpA [Alphaproteobacteria bacterium]